MENKIWNPADLLQLSGGYWSACALHASVKLDVFTQLGEGSMAAEELAGRINSDARGLAMLLNSLVALELLEKEHDSYRATPFAREFLSKSSSQYLGHIILHHHHLMESWAHLDQAVRSGGPVRQRVSHEAGEEERESFEMGMFNLAMQLAPKIVPAIDLSGRKRLLDMGGGPGTYAIHFCLHNPELTAVIYDLPSTRPFAERTISQFGLSDRIAFESGDFIKEGIKGTFDVAWLSHILHGEGPEGCAILLEKAISALEPGGMILIQEFILNDAKDGPIFPALFSMNMLLGTPHGQAYGENEIVTMLKAAGARDIRRLPVDLPNGSGIIAGIAGKN
ncbi:helix-turn-helix SAM-dependent methyltransferase [Geotalea daltonii FRC-32]|uniref:Helix-turn-helix SAM-dependent methyltransferase n=1 Tax=Geotalea daltonii (strain DSM 22248 / JCM 15807 / FRC-32) TaxID=316067 RepID=B9LZX0_GEODF|nr:methyltransferase [Geotalea daltonii]ACM18934.1 helix-turn-helix SAM-dependent methyltransferase [Geotalea daltonii FRC-32]